MDESVAYSRLNDVMKITCDLLIELEGVTDYTRVLDTWEDIFFAIIIRQETNNEFITDTEWLS